MNANCDSILLVLIIVKPIEYFFPLHSNNFNEDTLYTHHLIPLVFVKCFTTLFDAFLSFLWFYLKIVYISNNIYHTYKSEKNTVFIKQIISYQPYYQIKVFFISQIILKSCSVNCNIVIYGIKS